MGIEIELKFDRESLVFRPGEVITGAVNITTNSEVAVSGITLNFRGEGYVSFLASHGPRRRPHFNSISQQNSRKEYRNDETYFNTISRIPVETSVSWSSSEYLTILQAGYTASLPFSFELPTNIPSSCKLSHGGVHYFAEASLRVRESSFALAVATHKAIEKEFNVVGECNIDHVRDALIPVHIQQAKRFYRTRIWGVCFGSAEGQFEMDLGLERRGYCPGESIDFALDFSNGSNSTVEKLTAHLVQKLSFLTFGREKTFTNILATEQYGGPMIFPGKNGTWNGELMIPNEVAPTDLGGCRIIVLRYFFVVKAQTSHWGCSKIEAPITMGSGSPAGTECEQQPTSKHRLTESGTNSY